MTVAGVDGCRGGWLVALPGPCFHLCRNWLEVASLTAGCAAVAVDMPIGLPLLGQSRECDRLARIGLGPRRHSVFSAPARCYLHAANFTEVSGMSLQAFHLLPKIRQLDSWIRPEWQTRVWEAHPELVFKRLAGEPLHDSKKTDPGASRRKALLGDPEIPQLWPRSQVQLDDYLDALALLYAAAQPGEIFGTGQTDEKGLLMQIRG